MDFDAAMMRPIGLPALARCALDGTLRTSTSNRCSLSCSSRCFQRCPACSCSWNTATTRSGRWWRLHYNISCTRLVKWTPRVPASPALPALPHIHTYIHTQSHNRRHGSRLGAGRRGWDAAEQRSSGAEGDWRRRVRRVQRAPASRANRSRRRWQQQRRATSSSASRCRYEYGNDDGRLHQGKGSARALHPAAGPALYKTGPVDCHRVPTSAPPGRKDGFYLHHDVEDVCRSDRRAAGVGEESAQGARSLRPRG